MNSFNELRRTYELEINLTTSDIKVLKDFDPNFFPSPVQPVFLDPTLTVTPVNE